MNFLLPHSLREILMTDVQNDAIKTLPMQLAVRLYRKQLFFLHRSNIL